MDDSTCDLFVIGSGQAAEEIVEKCGDRGLRVTVAERAEAGGSCVNFGCTPSKTAIESGRLAALARRADEFGISIPTVRPDYARVLELARQKALESRQGVVERYGDRLVRGQARLAGREGDRIVVEVGGARHLTDRVVIDVGTRSLMPKIDGLGKIRCITAENWLYEHALPRRLVLLGGGYICVEMCQFYRRMGVEEVTVVDTGDQILSREDPDVAKAVQATMEAEGVRFILGTRFGEVRQTEGGIVLDCGGTPLAADALFVATGREPNTGDLGLETLGIETDDRGFVKIDERCRTNDPKVFCTGDARGGAMFTHTAWDDARVVLGAILGDNGHTTKRVVPYAVFTDPPLGRVGMGEKEAAEAGRAFDVLRFDLAKNAHADEARKTTGFIKVLLEKGTDKILGAAYFGETGPDLIHMYGLLMVGDLPASLLREAVITHPTYAEGVQAVLLR